MSVTSWAMLLPTTESHCSVRALNYDMNMSAPLCTKRNHEKFDEIIRTSDLSGKSHGTVCWAASSKPVTSYLANSHHKDNYVLLNSLVHFSVVRIKTNVNDKASKMLFKIAGKTFRASILTVHVYLCQHVLFLVIPGTAHSFITDTELPNTTKCRT